MLVCVGMVYLVWYSLHWKLSGNISNRLHIHMSKIDIQIVTVLWVRLMMLVSVNQVKVCHS